MMTWNGCKMEGVPWPDWTNNCSREGQGGQQEQEVVATIVWSIVCESVSTNSVGVVTQH